MRRCSICSRRPTRRPATSRGRWRPVKRRLRSHRPMRTRSGPGSTAIAAISNRHRQEMDSQSSGVTSARWPGSPYAPAQRSWKRIGLALWLAALVCASAASQPTMAVAAYRLDDTFRLPGANATGFVVSVRITTPAPGMTADDFVLRLFDGSGRPSGETTTLAIRRQDDDAIKQPWVLLDSKGLLERSYAPLIAAKTAVVEQGRKR